MDQFDWDYTGRLFLDHDFWQASVIVICLSVATWILGIVFGLMLALARQSALCLIKQVAAAYIWFFRSLPLLVLIIFVYNLPQFFPATAHLLSEPFWAGLIALVLSESAYIAEIHRGGLLAVPKGQHEAGRALGIGFAGRQRLIVIPQALRVALPALANEFVTIVKLTSLVSVISLTEILLVGQRLYTQNFKVIETLLAVATYYVLIVSVFSRLVARLELHLDVTKRPQKYLASHSQAPFSDVPPAEPNLAKSEQIIEQYSPLLDIRNVVKSFGGKRVLENVSLVVGKGEVISIIGPSGSGKTTLIRTINGLQDIDEGEILLAGRPWIHT